jgi:hypothetical protein
MTADYYMELHWECFQLWLLECGPVPQANDNPCVPSPYEECPL